MAEDEKESGEVNVENEKDDFDLTLSEENAGDLFAVEEEVDGKEKVVKEKVVEEEKSAVTKEEFEELKAQNQKLQKDLSRLAYEKRQEKKVEKAEDAQLSDADLAKIIEEHKDDPAVLLNTFKYVADQRAKKTKNEAIDEVDTKRKAEYISGVLHKYYGESVDDESSDLRQAINKAKSYAGFEDHPLGDGIGAGLVVLDQLPVLLKNAYERGKAEATNGTVEKKRVSSIENGKTFVKGKLDSSVTAKSKLSESELETAQRMGFKPGSPKFETYKRQILAQRAA